MASSERSGSTSSSTIHLPNPNHPTFNYIPTNMHDNERRQSPANRALHADFDDEATEEDLPPPAPMSASGSSSGNNETFDTLDEFGEDTLHALMDSDLRLGKMPPLASLRGVKTDRLGELGGFKMDELDEGEFEEEGEEESNFEESNIGDEMEEDFEEEGTMASSLLRGPLMAARSAMAVTTPSTARAQFVTSAMKPCPMQGVHSPFESYQMHNQNQPLLSANHAFTKQKSDAAVAHMTPSTARSTFLSTKKEPRSTSSNGSAAALSPSAYTPSNLVISTQKPPLHRGSGGVTPSAQREGFITSPQDSVSTIGSGQSVDHIVYRSGMGTRPPVGGVTPSAERRKFVDSPQDSLSHNGIGRMFTFGGESCEKENTGVNALSNDQNSYSSNQRGVTPSKSFTPGSNNTKSAKPTSVDRLIALGEEQMKQAAAANTNQGTAKKSFLKKGTRKEPSALHTLDLPDKTTTPTATCTPTNETASERKSRLARLEKMQEDLRKDYERREARKEEAQRERRRLKMKEMGSQGVVTSARLENVTRKKEFHFPSQVRARSVSRERTRGPPAADAGKDSVTPSRARARSALKSGRNKSVTTRGIAGDQCRPSEARSKSATPVSAEFETAEADFDNKQMDKHSVVEEVSEIVADPLLNSTQTCNNNTQSKTTSSQRRSRSVSRPKTAASTPVKSSTSPKRSTKSKNEKTSDEKAFEDWKKKEGEEWALIKNMRKRQEAALREAEGERERAKAWAAAERESTKKWVDEQRAIIKKDRHKAANAALLASKKAEKKTVNESDEINTELEELRSELTKMKLEAEEHKRLKEQLHKQEKTILALKSKKSDILSPTARGKSNERRVLEDCTSSSANQPKSSSKPKTPQSCRKPIGIIVDTSNDTFEEEEDTDRWLDRNLAELRSQNNEVERKSHNTPSTLQANITQEPVLSATQTANSNHSVNYIQRKPYNPADYGGPVVSSSSNQTPQKSPGFPHINAANPNPPKTSQFFTYQNGTQKEVLSDGTTTVYFTNGDRKRTYANEKKGIVVYYYAATQTTQVTHQDGKQTYHFPNKQIEDHHVDGTKEISYPDGTKRTIFTDGTTDTTFPDGVRVVDYPNGTQQVFQVSV